MSMMNANATATTAMTTNEPLDFELPEMGDADFSSEELAEDTDGLTMSFPRIKIPAGGVLQFEILWQSCSLCSYCPMRFWKSTMASALTVSLWNVSVTCGASASKAILHAKTNMKSLTTKRFDPMESCRYSIRNYL